jgi:hypothetical protein
LNDYNTLSPFEPEARAKESAVLRLRFRLNSKTAFDQAIVARNLGVHRPEGGG